MAAANIPWRDTKWDQLETLLLGRYKRRTKGVAGGEGERATEFVLFSCEVPLRQKGAHRLSPPTILSTVRTVSVSCVGRLACFNHQPHLASFLRSLRFLLPPLIFFYYFFFLPPSPFFFFIFAFSRVFASSGLVAVRL